MAIDGDRNLETEGSITRLPSDVVAVIKKQHEDLMAEEPVEIPPGWFSHEEYAEINEIKASGAYRLLLAASKSGKVHKRKFGKKMYYKIPDGNDVIGASHIGDTNTGE